MKIKEPVFIALRKEIEHLWKLEARERDMGLASLGDDITKHAEKKKRFNADRQYLTEFLELLVDKAAAGKEL